MLRYRSGADAKALLPVFLDDPAGRAELLPVLARHGDRALAERPAAATVTADGPRDGVPAGVLHALGCLGHEPVERLLWDRVAGRHDEAQHTCLGLAHLPCDGLRADIAAALERYEGSAVFPEFLPVLAAKTGDPGWLGEPYADLVDRLRCASDERTGQHCLAVFTTLLELRVHPPWCGMRMAPEPAETGEAFYELLSEWSTPHGDDSLIGLAHDVLDHRDRIVDDLYARQRLLDVRARCELA